MKQFEGKWTVVSAGEVLHGVAPMYAPSDTLTMPDNARSCGYNGGCSIFNSGEGFSVLSCDFDMYLALRGHFDDQDAWVYGYNAGVWFDAEDNRIAKMEKACRG